MVFSRAIRSSPFSDSAIHPSPPPPGVPFPGSLLVPLKQQPIIRITLALTAALLDLGVRCLLIRVGLTRRVLTCIGGGGGGATQAQPVGKASPSDPQPCYFYLFLNVEIYCVITTALWSRDGSAVVSLHSYGIFLCILFCGTSGTQRVTCAHNGQQGVVRGHHAGMLFALWCVIARSSCYCRGKGHISAYFGAIFLPGRTQFSIFNFKGHEPQCNIWRHNYKSFFHAYSNSLRRVLGTAFGGRFGERNNAY